MRKERKQELMYSFPPVPYYVEEQMKGKGALNFCVFLTNGHELFVRCFHRYKGGELAERQRYVFAKDGAVRYIFNEWQTPAWRVASKFREPLFASEYYPYAFDNTYAILNADAYRNSDMRYAQLGNHNFCFPMLYLKLYVRHPNVEYLIKAGYGHLIDENESYSNGKCTVTVNHHVDLKSNNLLKMLGLNREEFKLLKGWEKRYDNYLYYREAFPQYKPREVMEIVKAYGYERGTIDNHVSDSGLKPLRIARYINEQEINPRLYGDYLDQCRLLGYNMADTAITLPHDFHAMHARLSGLIKIKADEKTRQAFTRNYENRKKLEYSENGMFLRQPKSIEEIAHEGKVLRHCVGGYAERHAKGQTNILFLRLTDKPDMPFYTVEVSVQGKIMQCYGVHNAEAIAEVKVFMHHYQKYLSEVFHEKRNQQKLQQSA